MNFSHYILLLIPLCILSSTLTILGAGGGKISIFYFAISSYLTSKPHIAVFYTCFLFEVGVTPPRLRTR